MITVTGGPPVAGRLRVICSCGVRLGRVELTDHGDLGQTVGHVQTKAQRRAKRKGLPSGGYSVGWNSAESTILRHGRAEHSPTVGDMMAGHQKWEWRCGQCGRHQQATDERLAAAIRAGRQELQFGVDL